MVNGAILVGADGRILDVGPDARLTTPAGFRRLRATDAVLLPGLVNLHTHLELTGFRGAIPDADFYQWIQHVRSRKSATDPGAYVESARAGLEEAWSFGITTVADTGDSGAAARALSDLGGRGVVYQEVFGPHPDQVEDSMHGLVTAVKRLSACASERLRIGVSPHAPYTVSAPLFRRVVEFARAEGLPLAVHLAESPAETAFVTGQGGPFAEGWRRRHIPLPESARSPVAYLDRLGVLRPDTLVIHGVQADSLDARVLAERGSALALCPRSNARHGHGTPPLAAYLAAGVRLGLGSDSVASVQSPDLFAEARAARAHASLSSGALIRLLTLDAARAIGLEREIGSLEAGKWADLCLIEVPGPAEDPSAAAARILECGSREVLGTWVAGRLVHGSWPNAEPRGGVV